MINTEIDNKKITLLNIYAPTEKKNQDIFFLKMEKILIQYDGRPTGSHVLIAGGDFNCVNNPRLDVMGNKSVYKHPTNYRQFVKKFKMIDVWRKINKTKKQYTYRSKYLNMSSRIDYWLVQVDYVDYINNVSIKPVSMCPDHCAVTMTITLSCNNIRGSSYWKMNNSLLKSDVYKDGIKDVIRRTKNEFRSKLDLQYAWDLCKLRIKKIYYLFC